jgi:hypothetical protein
VERVGTVDDERHPSSNLTQAVSLPIAQGAGRTTITGPAYEYNTSARST